MLITLRHIRYFLLFFCCGLCLESKAYVNLALNESAYQQNPYSATDHRDDAENAVDGLKSDLDWDGGQCTISAKNRSTATWWVNLTSVKSIHHITVYYLTNNQPWGNNTQFPSTFLGFSVYVSNTTNRLQGKLCFKESKFTLRNIPAVINIPCVTHGQYVIYYNERLPGVTYPLGYSKDAYNNICELEVYGCPKIEYYGSNCSIPCPDVNCQYCHIETGTCQGCKPGYRGHRCELACKTGRYGGECGQICGHCSDLDKCLNINGTCLTGCNVGYQGELCQTPCDEGYYGLWCLRECSKFCKTTYDCDSVSGSCKDGCKDGWQGKDCLEVSSPDTENNLKFYGMMFAVCLMLIISGMLFGYILSTRRNRQTEHHPVKYQDNSNNDLNNMTLADIVNHHYEELNEPIEAHYVTVL